MRPTDDAVRRTNQTISKLAAQAGKQRPSIGIGQALAVSATLSLAAALAVICMLGVRSDLADMLPTWPVLFKIVAMSLCAVGAFALVRAAGTPGAGKRALLAMLPAILFLAAGAIFDSQRTAWLGVRGLSAPLCIGTIVLASVPGLLVVLAGLRKGIPTQLGWSGAAAGLLAGSCGALAYTLACVNDSATFVAIWYLVALIIMTVIGAVLGRHTLAW